VGVVVLVGLAISVSVGVGVDVFVGVIVSVGVLVSVLVMVIVGVMVRVRVCVGVGVMVLDGVLVWVGVRVTVRVGVNVGVRVMVGERVIVAVEEEVGAAVWVLGLGVLVGVFRMKSLRVGVRVGLLVRVTVVLGFGVALAVGSGVSDLWTAFNVLLGEGAIVLVCKPALVGVRVCFAMERSDPRWISGKKGRLKPAMIPVNRKIINRATMVPSPNQIHLFVKTLLVIGGATRIALGTPPSQPLMKPGQSTWGSRKQRLR
jgi:hypothetical protein